MLHNTDISSFSLQNFLNYSFDLERRYTTRYLTVQLFNLPGIKVRVFCAYSKFAGINIRASQPSSDSTIIYIESYTISLGI